ncbi:hypothetical protein K470DRAFT_299991 [Piedraia hortae CBS 480.64]|uniref:Uncharacterized protein n=1 Tax=Piedraia hortae CBS 480.64 TaxID=1314780 RepID=A0A6A7BZ81_9PEZI|nr:hypothetical protein K470DRAFT_299991 [Piedraia hortae CBS 480.64]
MILPSLPVLLGIAVVCYLSTFVVFAILRVVTGVSVQRLGFSGLRRISFTAKKGIKINVRGLGLSFHRPTFALPTWCSLNVTELVVTVDLGSISAPGDPKVVDGDYEDADGHGKLWRQLTETKEKIKRLHSRIHWIKWLDLVATATEVKIIGVGSLRLERLTLSVDTRSKLMGHSRWFQFQKPGPDTQSPAEWMALFRSLLFTPEGGPSTEILDTCTLSVHGLLHNKLQGLRDASISLKCGRLNVPNSEIQLAKSQAKILRGKSLYTKRKRVSLTDALEELENPGTSHEEWVGRVVADSRAFVASILRGIREVQLSVGVLGISQKLDVKSSSGTEIYFNFAIKQVSLDIARLEPKSPAHRMHFSTNDIAHQCLVTAIEISAGIEDGHEHPERILYVPMITATVRTTLLTRTIHHEQRGTAQDRNTNMLYANFVCTSPSIDLDPKHLPTIRNILKRRYRRKHVPSVRGHHSLENRHRLISQLLPKARVKLSIQEPVVRISLPPMEKADAASDEYDLLISSVTSIAIELESSHAADGGINYNLGSNYRHTKHNLYYLTAGGERHDLMQSDTVEVDVNINALPEPTVTADVRLRTFAIFLVRPEICKGLAQIVAQLHKDVMARHESPVKKAKPSFLRTVPSWLQYCRVEGSEFGLQLAGIDEQVSSETRGFALQLETWVTEYKGHREEPKPIEDSRRMSLIRPSSIRVKKSRTRNTSPGRKHHHFADDRKLTVNIQNLDGYIIDSLDGSEPESFMTLPQLELGFSTLSDPQGPIFHINAFAKTLLMQYSLYTHFAIGVAVTVVRNTFLSHSAKETPNIDGHPPSTSGSVSGFEMPLSPRDVQLEELALGEITAVDFKANLVQLKARMPSDPPMLLQISEVDAGKHRWTAPYVRAKVARMCVRAPRTRSAWSRIVSIKHIRLDVRDLKRKARHGLMVPEKSIDISTEMIRFAVPHLLVVHSVFDNITSVIKTSQQLQHHFATGTRDYILRKKPEEPKKVPRVTVRANLFLFDVEDGGFEWKLAAIYRTGLIEQQQRLAREQAFRMKERLVAKSARGRARTRAHSAAPSERPVSQMNDDGDVKSPRARTSHRHGNEGRSRFRYDGEARCHLSDRASVSVEYAREKLDQLNAQSWKYRIDRVLNSPTTTVPEIQHLPATVDEIHDNDVEKEPILPRSQRPALMFMSISDLYFAIDKPSFPLEKIPTFLHDVGKGMPYDMKYGMLLPLNMHIAMGELRTQLRDYPLPVMHVPQISGSQSARLPALSMRADFVVAEEFRDVESQRQVFVEVVPPEKMGSGSKKGFAVEVRRTISPVKTYSDMRFEINTSNPTVITWGSSYQPAIQDIMQVIEGFTKPPVDPSDRVGFWDKIRLSFHSRVNVSWRGGGDMHLNLKGSRDPYLVTGTGAGLVMVWRNDVRWNIGQSLDPKQFMTIDSGDYILAIPDFNKDARRMHESRFGHKRSHSTSHKNAQAFKKVIMKLSGNVRWLVGLIFQRDDEEGKQVFNFKPHYDVVLKHPDFTRAPPGQEYDAYRGFRSQHIHMSIGILAPPNRNWLDSDVTPSNNYNSVHLSPRFLTHFLNWWSMFSGVMSLPIRQGPLWGVTEKKSKKFGRHLATIKYSLLLSPLYVSHVYKHKDAEDYETNSVSSTGLKMKLDSFVLDLHQRREHFDVQGHGDVLKKTSGMRIHEAQLDFIHADLRAVSATISGASLEDLDQATDEEIANIHSQTPGVENLSRVEIPDNDFTWIDMDDFVELDWVLPSAPNPEIKYLPLGYAPRFTYFRQTDHGGVIAGDPSRTSPFGDEPTHDCVMTLKNDPRRVQAELIAQRLKTLREQKIQNQRAANEQELKIVRDVGDDKVARERLEAKFSALRSHGEHLNNKQAYLQRMLDTLNQRLRDRDPSLVPDLETSEEFFEEQEQSGRPEMELGMEEVPTDFNNRFIVHNAQIKWNNSLRNILLRYFHQTSQRQGFVYYMSRRAVRFILDIIEEQEKSSQRPVTPAQRQSQNPQAKGPPEDEDNDEEVQDRIQQLLKDTRQFVDAAEPQPSNAVDTSATHQDISPDYTPLNIYHFKLIAPQVQFQSEKNRSSAVLMTAKGMQLKVVQIMDKDNITDEVNGLVQRRFVAAADSLQMFVTSTKTFSTDLFHMYSANLYGTRAGAQWPPWVPMEIMFEFQATPFGFNRVVTRTSASMRYDKYNSLRLKRNDDVSAGEQMTVRSTEEGQDRMDHMWVEFPQLKAICDSSQYYALYIIVMDLLLYSEPLEKTRSERLEKIMLASDFSDLSGAPEMVQALQDRIRMLYELKTHFQVNEKYLDRQGWKDHISIENELASCEDELFFMMTAITTSQHRPEDRRDQDSTSGTLHLNVWARDIAWHLIREKNEPLLEFQLRGTSFDLTNNNDGSKDYRLEIDRIHGSNRLPSAIYPQIIGPFTDESFDGRHLGDEKMLRVHWLMLEAIAGISVVDRFEVNLVPLKLQLEREVVKKLFEYIFPGVGGNAFEEGGFSPFMVKNMIPSQDDDDDDGDGQSSYEVSLPSTDQSNGNSLGSLPKRLHPTLNLSGKGYTNKPAHSLGHHHDGSSKSWLSISSSSRNALHHRATNLNKTLRPPSSRSLASIGSDPSKKPPLLIRTQSDDKRKVNHNKTGGGTHTAARDDDLSQMLSRASNYMTLSYVRIPSMVLCLSYKGQGKRNLEDVHDLIFRMPTLEYRNKTWSNLDLALQLKKDAIRVLISHAGKIVGNKFTYHKARAKLANESSAQSSILDLPEDYILSGHGDDRRTSVATTIDKSITDTTSSTGFGADDNGIDEQATAEFLNRVDGSGDDSSHHHHQQQQQQQQQGEHPSGNEASRRPRGLFHFGGIRPKTSEVNSANVNGVDEHDEELGRKSRLLLGGQKLLRTLRE